MNKRRTVIIPVDHPLGNGVVILIGIGEPGLQGDILALQLCSGLRALQKAGAVPHNARYLPRADEAERGVAIGHSGVPGQIPGLFLLKEDAMDKAGRIVSAIVVTVRLTVKQQVVDVRVVFLHAVERRAHGVAAADHELCAALGGSAQGGLGLVCGVARGSLGVGGIAVRVGERLYALPQHGILAGFRAVGAGHQHDGLSAGQCGRRVHRAGRQRSRRSSGRLQCAAPARCWQPPYPCRRSALPAAPASEAVLRISSCGKGTPLVF